MQFSGVGKADVVQEKVQGEIEMVTKSTKTPASRNEEAEKNAESAETESPDVVEENGEDEEQEEPVAEAESDDATEEPPPVAPVVHAPTPAKKAASAPVAVSHKVVAPPAAAAAQGKSQGRMMRFQRRIKKRRR